MNDMAISVEDRIGNIVARMAGDKPSLDVLRELIGDEKYLALVAALKSKLASEPSDAECGALMMVAFRAYLDLYSPSPQIEDRG